MDALNSLPWWLILVVGLVGGWFARRSSWALGGFCSSVAERSRRGFEDFGRFVGRLFLVVAVVVIGVVGLFGLAHLLPGK